MSFQMRLKSHRLAGALFVTEVRDTLLAMLMNKKKGEKLKQADIARILEIDRSVVNRQLTGKADLSLMRVGELADIMGCIAEFKLVPKNSERSNAKAISDTVIDYTSAQSRGAASLSASSPAIQKLAKGSTSSSTPKKGQLLPKKAVLSPSYKPETLDANA
jgi:hypothetical protein